MAVILYLPKREKATACLLRVIKKAIPDDATERYSSIGKFSERLQRPMQDVSVAILYVANRTELMEINELGDLLEEIKVVLVLPDSDPDVLDKAYVLCPRFIAAAESDFKHLGRIIRRMKDLYDKTHGAR